MDENNIRNSRTFEKREIYYLALYIILFYAVWTFKESYVMSMLSNSGSLSDNVQYLIAGGIKILVWIVPVFVYLKLVNQENPLSYLKMDRKVFRGLLWGVIICAAYIGISLLKAYIAGTRGVNLNLNLDQWLNTVVLAGFTEEIVFRGFLLQKIEEFIDLRLKGLNKETAFWGANVISSVLFIFIHFPKWYFNVGQIQLQSILSVFVLGIAFGYTFKKTGSIWAPMIFHTTNNFIVLTILALS